MGPESTSDGDLMQGGLKGGSLTSDSSSTTYIAGATAITSSEVSLSSVDSRPEIGFLVLGDGPDDTRRITSILPSLKGWHVRVFAPDLSPFAEFAGPHCIPETCHPENPDALLRWMEREGRLVLVVDGGLEIIPTLRPYDRKIIVLRRHGEWNRAEHLQAFREADSLIAPFPKIMEQPEIPDWVREKTEYCGGLLRVGELFATPTLGESLALKEFEERRKGGARHVTLYLRDTKAGPTPETILEGAALCSDWEWVILGDMPLEQEDLSFPSNIRVLGDVTSPQRFFRLSDVVVGDADDKTVTEVALAGVPYICIPQEALYNEQRVKADILRTLDVATVLERWPIPTEWGEWFTHATALRRPLHVVLEESGARRAAQHIESRLKDR